MDKFLIYNHPSVPTKGILVNKQYVLEDLLQKFTLEEVKGFFQPTNFTFEELEVNTVKTIK